MFSDFPENVRCDAAAAGTRDVSGSIGLVTRTAGETGASVAQVSGAAGELGRLAGDVGLARG